MSNLSAALNLVPSTLQLPVTAYFDEALYQQELKYLFRPGPGYLGHQLMVPEIGDYCTLAAENEGRILVRNEQGIEVLSNVCRHRQAVMLNGRGNTRNIVCPLHRWTYSLQGELIGAPHFEKKPCLNLGKTALQNWQGLLFDGERDVRADLDCLGVNDKFDFSGYMLEHIEVHECHYNWKTFIEVYLEDYHVQPFHPGLGNFVTCDDLQWKFGDWSSAQIVGVNAGLGRPGSPVYQKWQQALLNFNQGAVPEQGAIWLTYFPNVMVEWYPHALIVSTLYPQGPRCTKNVVEFYYPEEIVLFERELAEAERAAYMETCQEDDEIAERMDAGRRILMNRGINEVGPYQSPMEDGMQHFHQWYRKMLHL
jgi:choline monooxygenase